MFRLWGKIFTDNRMLYNYTVEDDSMNLNRTKKIYNAIDVLCHKFDLSKPIWLEHNIEEFKRLDKTRFTQDNFIDSIDFDYLEIHVIEED